MAACAARVAAPAPPDRIAIVVVEASARGARIVALDEHGDRRLELLDSPGAAARDLYPAISPDGRWLVFASSRERAAGETSLWIAPLAPEARARRLTDRAAIDTHPTWMPDGRAIVFASTRGGAGYDLYRVEIADGALERLTSAPGHETTPSVARDGTIYYAAIVPGDGDAVTSRIEARAPDGTIRAVTDGPADSSPAISPDGTTLVLARPSADAREPDAELWRMPAAGGAAERLVALPATDEGGPAWSRDGRYVFATSVFWSAGLDDDGRPVPRAPLVSSVIAIDLAERERVARILEDRSGPIARLAPAIAPVALDHAALHADAEYAPELARVLHALAAKRVEAER